MYLSTPNYMLPVPLDETSYLGYVWRGTLSAASMVEQTCNKARMASFAYGNIGTSQGDLSPVRMFYNCVFLVSIIILHGSANWCMTECSFAELDSLLGDLSKRFLKEPKWFSKHPWLYRIVLGWDSIALCVLS